MKELTRIVGYMDHRRCVGGGAGPYSIVVVLTDYTTLIGGGDNRRAHIGGGVAFQNGHSW